ncbi:MAG TPA: phage baseplate assembly protein V [Micromonosporaceae bacterium]|nr:phage baseplate assembly protein V [Micromonosporaceae bacterium]
MTTATTGAVRSVTVRVDGRPVPGRGSARLLSARVATRLNQPAQCEVAFATSRAGPAPLTGFPLGGSLWLGLAGGGGGAGAGAGAGADAAGAGEPLFTGEITCVEQETEADGTTTVRLRAYDRLHRLRKRQELRAFESVTAAGLAGQLAGAVGLRVAAESDGPLVERLLQHRHTDLELLLEVCGRAGLYLYADGDELRLVTLAGRGQPVPLDAGRNLWRARVEVNLDQAAGSSAALGWHPQRAEALSASTGEARSGRQVAQRLDAGAVGGDGARTLVDQPGRSDDEMEAIAQAAFDVRVASAVTVDGVAEGNAALKVGGRVAIGGVSEQVAGVYVLTEVVHTVDAAGHLTAFSTSPPPVPAAAAAASVTLGTVTAVDDPDGLGRVRVTLPALGGLDAGWLAVVCPGAGSGRGIVALPDVDDTVLVALPHGEPASGLVVGSLYGTVAPPDAGVDGGRVRRWSLRTAEGQSIIVDNAGRTLRLGNDVGSFVELTPDRLTVHAATDLVVQAPGRALTVRARTVDFEHAPQAE